MDIFDKIHQQQQSPGGDIFDQIHAQQGATQQPLNQQSQAEQPSFMDRLTAPYDPGAAEFGDKHPVLGPLVRFLSGAGGAALGLPGSIYHAAADPLTPEEEQEFKGHTRIPGEVTLERLTGAPLVRAAEQYANPETRPTLKQAAGILPEALGQGAGTVAGAELLGRLPRGAQDVVNNLRGKAAPAVADTALGVRALDRRRLPAGEKHGIGQAALDETTANTPEGIADQAQTKLADLSQQLESVMDQSPAKVSLRPALDTLDQIRSTADAQNDAATLKVVGKVRKQLTQKFSSGQAIPGVTTARQVLDLKRGIGKLKNWDSNAESAAAAPVVEQVYGALDSELDNAVPESQGLNQRLSLLMKVSDRAEAQLNRPGMMERMAERAARPTGAMAAPLAAGVVGGSVAGIPGAVAGGALGMLGQEALASPRVRMGMARGLKPGIRVPPRLPLASAGTADQQFWDENMAAYRKRHPKY